MTTEEKALAMVNEVQDERGAIANCSMGVGCDEMGICYANANGKPENCPKQSGDNLKGLHNEQNFNMCDHTC